MGPGPPDDQIAGVEIDGGARFVARPEVSVEVRGPPGAVRAELANAADFAGAVPVPLGRGVPWRLDDGGPDGPRRVFARFLGAGGHLLPGFDRADAVELDRAAPVLGRPRAHQTEPVLVCEPGGRAVAGTSRRRIRVAVRTGARDPLSGLRTIQVRSPLSHPRTVGDAPWSLPARPGGTVEVRAIDRVGNASPWRSARVPAAAVDVLDPATRPFTRATACPSIGQARLIRRVDRLWRAAGAPGRDRALLRPARIPSDLDGLFGSGALPQLGSRRDRAQRPAARRLGRELPRGRLRGRRVVDPRSRRRPGVPREREPVRRARGRAPAPLAGRDGHGPDPGGPGSGRPAASGRPRAGRRAAHRGAVPRDVLRRAAPGGRRRPPRGPEAPGTSSTPTAPGIAC